MAVLFDTGIFSVVDNDGSVGAGWKLAFYNTGTTTNRNTYPTNTDADAGTNPNANPVISNAEGRFPSIWLDDGAYKVVLRTSADLIKVVRDPAITPSPSVLLKADLAATTGLSLIGTPEGTAYDLLYSRSALSLVRGPKTFARTWQRVLDLSADLSAMRGFAALAGTTGGAGKPVFKVWNDSDDVNTVGSLRWAVAAAKASGGGRILGVEEGQHTVQFRTRIWIDFDNVTIAFPGRNWRFGALNNVEMVRISGKNVIIRDMPLFRYPHYTAVDNQLLEYSSANSNLIAGQTVFAVSFPYFLSSNLRVTKNIFDTLTETTDYTVTATGGSAAAGYTGTVTLVSPVAISDRIRIYGQLYQQDGISIRPETSDRVWIDRCTLTDHTDGALDISNSQVQVGLAATALAVGLRYEITDLGTTNWNTAAGTSAVTYVVGSVFTCAVVGTGTGVVRSAPCRVTVSRCLIRNQLEAMAIGSSATSALTPPPAWAATALDQSSIVFVTLDSNVFEAVSQRAPRVAALAYVHSVNNVHIMSAYRQDDGATSVLYGAWANTGGKLYSQADYMMRGGTDTVSNGMYATTTAWDAATRIGPGAFRFLETVAETGISLTSANTAYVTDPPYTLVSNAVPAVNRLDYVRTVIAGAGAETSPLAEMVYTFVAKTTGDADGLYPDGVNVVSVQGGYRVRTQPAVPSTGDNAPTSFVAGTLSFPRGVTITIASDTAILRDGSAFYAMDTEAAAAADNLATISPVTGTVLPDGYVFGFRPASSARAITVTSAGNILLPTGPIVLDSVNKLIWLRWGASQNAWSVVSAMARREGEYTPALTGLVNVASSAVNRFVWSQETGSNYIAVQYSVTITPTTAGLSTDLGISLPIASDLAVGADLMGAGAGFFGSNSAPAQTFGDAVNNRATLRFVPPVAGASVVSGSFQYKVL